jgi:predicted tellurium resistance membrane protein TerC
MYYILFIILISVNLFAGDKDFKPLPNWLFFTIIILLILAKIFIGKLIKNKVKNKVKVQNIEPIQKEEKKGK